MNAVRFAELGSTNTEALCGDYPEGTVIVAEHQTCGRGQRGNVWSSEASCNLTMTVVHYPDVPVTDSFPISMAAAMSIVDLLLSYGIVAKVKWPNDIYVGDSKIAGILIENSLAGSSVIRKSVIGIGLNVGQTVFPDGIPNPTSMALCGCRADVDGVLERFMEIFPRTLERSGELFGRYTENLWRREGFHPYQDDGGRFEASVHAIDPHTGRLSLRRRDGRVSQYYFKEVRALLK